MSLNDITVTRKVVIVLLVRETKSCREVQNYISHCLVQQTTLSLGVPSAYNVCSSLHKEAHVSGVTKPALELYPEPPLSTSIS